MVWESLSGLFFCVASLEAEKERKRVVYIVTLEIFSRAGCGNRGTNKFSSPNRRNAVTFHVLTATENYQGQRSLN